jgi:hypothetical protein
VLSDDVDAAEEDAVTKVADSVGVGELDSSPEEDADRIPDDDEASDPDAVLEAEMLLEPEISLNEKLSLTGNERPLDDELSAEVIGITVGNAVILPPNPRFKEDGMSVEVTIKLASELTSLTGEDVADDDSLPPKPRPREFGSTVELALMINESIDELTGKKIDETSVAELKSDELPPEKIGKPPGYPSSQGSDK